MKSSLLVAAFAAAADAHYIFSQLLVDGRPVGRDFQYIRKNSNSYQPSFPDILSSPDYRCNRGANSGAGTQTYTVPAGSSIGAKLAFNEFIEHPGPAWIWLSKVPAGKTASTYDGSGDWFKIWEAGLNGASNNDRNWATWQKPSISATIPASTPPGEYLVRFESLAIHENHVGKGQFYVECAQVKITGNGGGVPGPLVKIPGVLNKNSPQLTFSKWGPAKPYPMPAPQVWRGGAASGGRIAADADVNTSADDVAPVEAAASPAQQPNVPKFGNPGSIPNFSGFPANFQGKNLSELLKAFFSKLPNY